jgi:hypothetical protein
MVAGDLAAPANRKQKPSMMEHDEEDAVERLDEQPPHTGKRPAWVALEWLVGVLLLVGVAGWSSWDWWQQQTGLSNYRAGDHYASAHDWDAARTAFLTAGDFKDARARAAGAAQKIHDRDSAYAAAQAESAAGKWAAALRDFRHVREITPGFRDSVSMERHAEQQVYMLALSGAVALRAPAAGSPGLYLYMANGWNYLPGSDASSQVRSNSASPCVVYDTPFPPGPGGPTPGATVIPGGPRDDLGVPLRLRTLMVAQSGGGMITARPLAFDPMEFSGFTCDDSGVMGENYTADGNYLDVRLAYARDVQFYTPGYQAYTSTMVTRVPLPGPAWAILADNSYKRLVVGNYTNVLGYHPETELYVSDPQGRLGLVATRQAIVQAAWLSPDGRYLLSDEFIPDASGPQDHRLVLLTTDGSRLPEVLMSTKRHDLLVVGNAWYDAAFIDSGVFAGKLLIERKTYPAGELRLIDPTNPQWTIWTTDQIDFVDRLHVMNLSNGMLLPLSSMSTNVLPALYVDAHGKATTLALPVRYGDSLAAAREIEGRLVYTLLNRSAGPDLLATLYSTALPGTTATDPTPTELIAIAGVPGDPGQHSELYNGTGQRWNLGPGLLAYTKDGQLQVRTYDGAISLPLQEAVLALYPLRR